MKKIKLFQYKKATTAYKLGNFPSTFQLPKKKQLLKTNYDSYLDLNLTVVSTHTSLPDILLSTNMNTEISTSKSRERHINGFINWRCPCSLQGQLTRWPLKVPSSPKRSVILWISLCEAKNNQRIHPHCHLLEAYPNVYDHSYCCEARKTGSYI